MSKDISRDRVIISSTDQFVPPPGGRVHVLTVPVILDRLLHRAVIVAGPNTQDSYNNVWKVGKHYPPIGIGTAQTKIILVNFGTQGGSLAKAITWAEQYDLKLTDPRLVFAIGEHSPRLDKELKMDIMQHVVSTRECSFEGHQQVCVVWWFGKGRGADLRRTDKMGSPDDWFAFTRE